MTRRLAAAAMGLFLWAPSSAVAVPLHASRVVSSSCPQSTEATFQIRLSVPSESAPDRSTLMSVVSSANYLRGEWLAAQLDFFDAAGGAISTHPFSDGEIRLMNDRTSISERGHYPFLEFPVQIPERGGPVTIRLTVRLHADEGPECEVVFQRIIRHIPGVPPRPELFTAKLHKGGIGEGPSETGELV